MKKKKKKNTSFYMFLWASSQDGGKVPEESGPTESDRSYITFCDLTSKVIKPAEIQ